MSEYINNGSQERRQKLLALGLGMLEGKTNPDFVSQFTDFTGQATARDIIFVVDGMVKASGDMEELKKAVSRLLNLLYEPLNTPEGETGKMDRIPFLKAMLDENREMDRRMKELKFFVKSLNTATLLEDQRQDYMARMLKKLEEMEVFDRHYLRKENILFPYLEKAWPDFRCLHVMWSLHDDARKSLKELQQELKKKDMQLDRFNELVGEFFFSVLPLIFREEKILFPVAAEEIPESDWDDMTRQSASIGYAWIDTPEILSVEKEVDKPDSKVPDGLIDLETGLMSVEEIVRVFNHLPVDMTYVDENDEVRFFSNPKNRHFPRSKAIIGRKVQNCHPPESIDIVNRIVEAFRKGEKDKASFWINMHGRMILIRYFAVRDEKNRYKGVLEVSQDITEIKKLEGERRLLDW
ncbi:MAG: DUF438 domain-containing protein [Bacteroidales bacterium]